MKNLYLIFLFCLGACVAGAQDSCHTALPVGFGIHSVDVVNGEAPPLNCINHSNGDHGKWYKFTTGNDSLVTVTTDLDQNWGIDTRFHIYTGTCGDLTCASGDDDAGSGYLSEATFNVLGGVSYYIVFDNNWDSDGFDFEIAGFEPPIIGFVTAPYTHEATIRGAVDMNNDHLDDILGTTSSQVHINYQLPEGGFETGSYSINAENSPSWSLAAGDLDGNGYNDMVYGGGSGASIIMANEDGTGYAETYKTNDTAYVFSQRTNMVDIDNDGRLDVFVCHDVDTNIYLMNTPEGLDFHRGGLGDQALGGNYGSIWVDYDNDHDMDLFIAKCRGGNSPAKINELHRNNGDGTFTEVGEELGMNHSVQTWSSAWGDYDNDGDLDALIGASSFFDGHHVMMVNNGDGTFTDQTEGTGFENYDNTSIEWVTHDFDNDGYLDILGGNSLMRNNGDMTFSEVEIPFDSGPIGDLNNDGFLDVIDDQLYVNVGNDNNYIVINTIGTASNVNGIGARVKVYGPSFDQIREVRSGDGFRYMSSLNSYFGLGQGVVVDSVIVQWPSGMTDIVYDPPINSALTITEGQAPVAVNEVESPELLIFPNPAEGNVVVHSPISGPGALVTIIDMNGRVVSRQALKGHGFDVSGLPAGAYVFRLENKGRFAERKLIVR